MTRLYRILVLLGGLAAALGTQAAPPQLFMARYNSSYEGLSADAVRRLEFNAESGNYHLSSDVSLSLFGATLASIQERSEFQWQDEQPLPLRYEFVQKGFRARTRRVDFDHSKHTARFRDNRDRSTVVFEDAAFDELSGYLVLREQLAQGALEAHVPVIDRGELRDHHYRVLDRELLDTPVGQIQAVHLERVRAEDSERKTEIWLAPDHDYLLLKLVQTEPGGRVIRLEIREAELGGKPLTVTVPSAPAR